MPLALPPLRLVLQEAAVGLREAELAELRHRGGEEQRSVAVGLCKARTLRTTGLMWADQEELRSKRKG